MEMMERVMHKTLIALNKEKTAWTGSSGNGGGGRWNRLLNSGFGVNVTSSINNKKSRNKWLTSNAGPAARLTVDSVTFSSQCVSQSDGRRSRPSHIDSQTRSRSRSVGRRSFRIPCRISRSSVSIARHRCPAAQRGLDDSSFRVSFFYLFGSFHSAEGNLQIGSMGVVFFRV